MDEKWEKLAKARERKRAEDADKFFFTGMSIIELHAWEDEAQKTLEKLDPDHPALKYYGSTYAAIEAYEEAIQEVKARPRARGEKDGPTGRV